MLIGVTVTSGLQTVAEPKEGLFCTHVTEW